MPAQHILVPIDFSPDADTALTQAMALALALDARLTLLHVIHMMPLTVGEVPPFHLDAYMEELENDAQQQMQITLQRVHRAGLQGDSAIVHGVPFDTIVDMARDEKVDMIVMGTHGRTGLPHALMGSVAEKVVRLAPCPVLVSREKCLVPTT